MDNELNIVINKLKKVLSTVKDEVTQDTLESFIGELQDQLDYQKSQFNQYFGEA